MLTLFNYTFYGIQNMFLAQSPSWNVWDRAIEIRPWGPQSTKGDRVVYMDTSVFFLRDDDAPYV